MKMPRSRGLYRMPCSHLGVAHKKVQVNEDEATNQNKLVNLTAYVDSSAWVLVNNTFVDKLCVVCHRFASLLRSAPKNLRCSHESHFFSYVCDSNILRSLINATSFATLTDSSSG